MARRDDSTYDWRGIAMLTQQLGQLFEPSKVKLMSQQHEHEMNMLMAKQAWDMQSKEVVRLKSEYDALQVNINAFEDKLYGQDLKELVTASMTEGAKGNEASEVFDNTSGKALKELHDTARDYEKMISQREETLDTFQLYDATAKIGEKWSDELTARPTEKREDVIGKDYKVLHDADKSGTLSWAEQNNALKDYIKDYYAVPEGQDGMDITIGTETLQAAPEALAFLAGFRHVRGRKGVDAAEAAAQVSKLKTPDQYLNTMYQARKEIQGYEQGGMNVEELKFLEGEVPEGFTSADVDIFTASHSLFKEAYKAYTKAGHVIPDDLKGVAPVSPDMFDEEGRIYGTNPNEFAKEGLDYNKYTEIQRSDNEIHKKIAFEMVYNWDDIMKTGSDTEKSNMLKSLELLKKAYNF
jgi:hypothetical protein